MKARRNDSGSEMPGIGACGSPSKGDRQKGADETGVRVENRGQSLLYGILASGGEKSTLTPVLRLTGMTAAVFLHGAVSAISSLQ